MPVDQQTWRRIARTGLTGLDREKACPGYFVYSPTTATVPARG